MRTKCGPIAMMLPRRDRTAVRDLRVGIVAILAAGTCMLMGGCAAATGVSAGPAVKSRAASSAAKIEIHAGAQPVPGASPAGPGRTSLAGWPAEWAAGEAGEIKRRLGPDAAGCLAARDREQPKDNYPRRRLRRRTSGRGFDSRRLHHFARRNRLSFVTKPVANPPRASAVLAPNRPRWPRL